MTNDYLKGIEGKIIVNEYVSANLRLHRPSILYRQVQTNPQVPWEMQRACSPFFLETILIQV